MSEKKKKMPRFNLSWFYVIIAVVLGFLFLNSNGDMSGGMSKTATYTEFKEYVKKGYASRIEVNKNQGQLNMYVKADFTLSDFYQEIILDELNIKQMAFSDDLKVEYALKPQLKTVGPKFGKLVGAIRTTLAGLDGAEAVQELNETGAVHLNISGEEIALGREDLLIEIAQTEGFVTQADQGVTVMLDTTLTPELIEEGFVRELVSKIQTIDRKSLV